MVPNEQIEKFERDGFALAEGLFSKEECAAYIDYFMAMIERGGDGWAEGGVDPNHPDPLKRYPRLLQPHRGDKVAFDYMIDARNREWLAALLGEDPFAVQTMVYFKPAGARGQALHQDQRYLRVEPGTCMAAWLALEDCDEENGCMSVVPGSHKLPVLCPGQADAQLSFTGDQVPIPPGLEAAPMRMKAGDVLFFNGQLIHGSGPNESKDRFRRIIVGHYIVAEAKKVAQYYFPVFNMDGSTVDGLEENPWGGGPCGYIVERDGNVEYQMVGSIEEAAAAH